MKRMKFKLNRRAMVIGFLTTMILTIIVFSFAGCITSKLLRTSSQAKENFGDFVDEVEQVYANKDFGSEGVSFPLILDSGTVLVYFTSARLAVEVDAVEQNTVIHFETGAMEIPSVFDYKVSIIRPETCLAENEAGEVPKGCFCLFQEVSKSKIQDGEKQLSSPQGICQPVYFGVKYNAEDKNCGIGIPINVNSYHCPDGGFFIDRDVLCDKDVKLSDKDAVCYKNGRRINLHLKKVGTEVLIKEQ